MFYKKKDSPVESEIVLCTVKKVLPNSIFASLDEYINKEGLIHISEIAPGRIRNIRDYVKEGKTIVCKVIRVNVERGHIDLSLRRVSTSAKSTKLNSIKQEERHEKLLETAAKSLGTDLKGMFEKAGNVIVSKYGSLDACFQEVAVKGDKILTDLGIEKKIVSVLSELIKEKIKPQTVSIKAVLKLTCASSNGIEVIKKALKKVLALSTEKNKVNVVYLGAPRYQLSVISSNYKDAELVIKQIESVSVAEISKEKGSVSIEREK